MIIDIYILYKSTVSSSCHVDFVNRLLFNKWYKSSNTLHCTKTGFTGNIH